MYSLFSVTVVVYFQGATISTTQQPAAGTTSRALHKHQHSGFFSLSVHLKEGHDLVIRDSCGQYHVQCHTMVCYPPCKAVSFTGTSDPYVRFKVGGKTLYKSCIVFRNLNPVWDESFDLALDDVTHPLRMVVFDHDRINDDFMGCTEVDLSVMPLDE